VSIVLCLFIYSYENVLEPEKLKSNRRKSWKNEMQAGKGKKPLKNRKKIWLVLSSAIWQMLIAEYVGAV